MKALHSLIFSLLTIWIVTSCAGTGSSGPGSVGGGPLGGESTGGSGLDAVGVSSPVGNPTLGQASGDGTLGSQSSSVDLEPKFFRKYSLFFAGDQSVQMAEYKYVLPKVPGSLPSAQVLKIFDEGMTHKEVPCLACEGRYVRAINCGPHSDSDILQSLTQEELNNPTASNPLLWYLLHMPRATGNLSVTVCEGATYQDFLVSYAGVVDLEDLKIHPNEILVFYLLPEEIPPEMGPISTSGMMQIAKEGIAATSKEGLIRYTRPKAALQLNQEAVQIIKLP